MARSRARAKKRAFYGNQYTKPVSSQSVARPAEQAECCSSRKLVLRRKRKRELENKDKFYMFLHSSVLQMILQQVGRCPSCNSQIVFESDFAKRNGFCLFLSFIASLATGQIDISHPHQLIKWRKVIVGKGRLSNRAINTMQNYYGMAIRQNTDNLYAMCKAAGAVLYHCSDIKKESIHHRFCPHGTSSCCKWQSDRVTGKKEYKQKVNLPLSIKNELVPIFKDLSSESLLSNCLHGLTQNANEALNNIIWKSVQRIFLWKRTLSIWQ